MSIMLINPHFSRSTKEQKQAFESKDTDATGRHPKGRKFREEKMEISIVSPVAGSGVAKNANSQPTESTSNKSSQSFGPDYNLSLSASVQVRDFQATYSVSGKGAQEIENSADVDDANPNDLDDLSGATKDQIHDQVQARAISLLNSYLGKNTELKTSLGDFFRNNPEALQDISEGKIPDYFNVDNTARRILDIYFQRYDGGDRQAFVDRAKGIINQAYNEVEGEVGALPDIVHETRNKIMDILNRFAAGGDVSDFVEVPSAANQAAAATGESA